MTEQINDTNFFEKTNSGKILVKFTADWCGPCKAMKPLLEELSTEVDAVIADLDVDSNPETTSKFGIRSIPTFILFDNGIQRHKHVGAASKQQLLDILG